MVKYRKVLNETQKSCRNVTKKMTVFEVGGTHVFLQLARQSSNQDFVITGCKCVYSEK